MTQAAFESLDISGCVSLNNYRECYGEKKIRLNTHAEVHLCVYPSIQDFAKPGNHARARYDTAKCRITFIVTHEQHLRDVDIFLQTWAGMR